MQLQSTCFFSGGFIDFFKRKVYVYQPGKHSRFSPAAVKSKAFPKKKENLTEVFLSSNSSACSLAWAEMHSSPLYGCFCPSDYPEQEQCLRIFHAVQNNPCVGKSAKTTVSCPINANISCYRVKYGTKTLLYKIQALLTLPPEG